MTKVKAIIILMIMIITTIIGIYLPKVLDSYFRQVVNETMEHQIEQRRSEIDAQIQDNIRLALKDQQTQQQVQVILRQAVAAELEENGESYLRQVIERRAPHAIPLLFPNDPTPTAQKN